MKGHHPMKNLALPAVLLPSFLPFLLLLAAPIAAQQNLPMTEEKALQIGTDAYIYGIIE